MERFKIELEVTVETIDMLNKVLHQFKISYQENDEWSLDKLKQAGLTLKEAENIEKFRLALIVEEMTKSGNELALSHPFAYSLARFCGSKLTFIEN